MIAPLDPQRLALAGLVALVAACAKPSPPPPAPAGPGPRWDDGAHYAYRLTLSSATELGAGNVLLDLQLTGGLELYARRAGDGSVALVARLDGLRVDGKSAGGNAQLADLARDLQRPWTIELRDGLVEAIRIPAGAPAAVAGIERTLAAALQFAPPPSEAATAWTAIEHDATGRYTAAYRALAEPGRYARRKLRYDRLLFGVSSVRPGVQLAPGAQGDPPEVARSTGEIELADGQLRASRSDDELRAHVTPTTPASSQTSLALTLTGTNRDPAPAELSVAESVRLAAGEPYAPKAPPLPLDAAKAAGWTFERAIAELEELERTREPPAPPPPGGAPEPQTPADTARAQRMAAAFNALAAIFRREPATIRRAAALLRKGGPAAQAIMDALGSSTTGDSQAALLEIAADPQLPAPLRQGAAGSIIRSERPGEAAVAGLTGLLDDPLLAEYASYGLGSFARKLRGAGEAERARRISDLLLQRLAAAREQTHKVVALRGIANSAYAGALDAVRPYLTDDNPIVRAAAIEALRLVDLPEVDRLIAERLTADPRPVVRSAALTSAQLRPASPTLLAAVAETAAKAPDAQGRLQAVRLLARWLPEKPAAVQPALERAARDDAEPKVRAEAQRALDAAHLASR